MDRKKMDARIDKTAEQAKETMGVMSEMIDQATHCAEQTGQKIKNSVKEGTLKATDKIEEAVTTAANRVREKVHK